MSVWGRRGSYQAVALVISAWVVVNGVAVLLKPLIPKDENPRLMRSSSVYVREAADQKVKWRQLSQNPFLEARQLDRPICLVMGASWSTYAGKMDSLVFDSPEVAERLNREFIPVRIDLQSDPAWGTAYLPLLRASMGADPGFLIVTLRPSGELLTWASSAQQWGRFADTSALLFLSAARRFSESKSPSPDAVSQSAEMYRLVQSGTMAVPDGPGYLDRLKGQKLPENVGSPSPVYLWTALESHGAWLDLQASVDHAIEFGLFDWMDGGMYRFSANQSWTQNDFSESSVQTAMAAQVLARLSRKTGQYQYQLLAEKCFDAVVGRFLKDDGLAAFSTSELKDNGRSRRQSFTMEDLRVNLTEGQSQLASRVLNLDPRINPQMVARVNRWDIFENRRDEVDLILRRMRRLRTGTPLIYGGRGCSDSTGLAVASLLVTADLWQDHRRMDRATDLFGVLSSNRVGLDDVVHDASSAATNADPFLGDYLAYATACLARFQVQGNRNSLSDGERVLNRALALFMSKDGQLVDMSGSSSGASLVPQLPSMVDGILPGTTSVALNVLSAYSALGTTESARLRYGALARRIGMGEANAANQATAGMGSFFAATSKMLRGTYVVTGPDALLQCQNLRVNHPGVWIFPLVSAVWESGDDGDPGLHAVVDGRLGPRLSDAQLSALVSRNS